MIAYNIRANGPYEYDKFILNYGQIYNLYADTKDAWKTNDIWAQDQDLSEKIGQITSEQNPLQIAAIIRQMLE